MFYTLVEARAVAGLGLLDSLVGYFVQVQHNMDGKLKNLVIVG